MVTLADARLPEGLRLYAIGDVHGRLDMLEAVESRLRDDLARDPPGDFRTVMIGDYIDRGPDSRGVLAWLADRREALRLVTLRGNHEAMMEAFLDDPSGPAHPLWLGNGGEETLESFGLGRSDPFHPSDSASRAALARRLRAALAEECPGVLEGLEMMHRAGDYVFVHAGLRPGVALGAQSADDLLWIREPFLESRAEFDAVVVHGHTPTRHVVMRPNRIGIDTGAVFGGPLTCLVLQGGRHWMLGRQGRVALEGPAGP